MKSTLGKLVILGVAVVAVAASMPVSSHHVSKVDNRWVQPYGIQVLFHVPVAAGYEPVPAPQHCTPGAAQASTFYSQNFEGAHGYAFVGTPLASGVANLWKTTTFAGAGGDAGHSGPTRLYYGNPSTGNYNAGHTAGAAQSPAIAIPATPTLLTFATKWQVEWLKGYDHLWIEALDQNTGRTWLLCTANAYDRADPTGLGGNTFIPSCSPFHFNPCPSAAMLMWETRAIELPQAVLGHTIQLRFNFDSADDKANPYMGWMIDDVQLGPALPA